MWFESVIFSGIATGALLYSLSAQGSEPYQPLPGAYRPTGDFSAPGNQQFMPPPRGTRYQQPAPGGHPYGARSDLFPYGYPVEPLPRNRVPAYDLPPPAPAPGWNSNPYLPAPPTYGQQPASPKPATPAPRPFSNRQQAEETFVQRPDNPGFGRSDRRFRPPELKGTP